MNDIIGQAIHNQYYNLSKHKLWINNRYGPKEEMPVATYFREEDDMPDMEWLALNECRGKVLDIGAAAGCHTLILQQRELDVTALDTSVLAVDVMKARGIKKAILADIYTYNQGKFDTLLMLMNGIGLAGTIDGLKELLKHLSALLNPGGQIMFDSSDVAYVYEGKLPETGYYGEIWYQYEYNKQTTDWFKWLYVDEQTMLGIARETGFTMDVLLEDEFGQYLTRLTKIDD
jgi:SAM-dependent methyltransferase